MLETNEHQPTPENNPELTEADINALEFQAYNEVLDNIDGCKQELGLERGSQDYRRLEQDYKFQKTEFERKHGQSPEEATEHSLFGRLKMFLKPAMRKDLKIYRQTEAKLHTIENNIINITPGVFKNSEAYQKILKSEEASSKLSKKVRSSLLRKKIEQDQDNKFDHTSPTQTKHEKIQKIIRIEEKTKETEARYDQAITDSGIIQGIKSKPDKSKDNTILELKHFPPPAENQSIETIKPGIMKDERGQILEELGDLDKEKREENITLEAMTEPMRQKYRQVSRQLKMVDSLNKYGSGLINFDGSKMVNAFYNLRATKDRLESTLGFDPTQGSRIKAWIGAARKLGLAGLSVYKREMTRFDNAQKKLTKMENALENALDKIKNSKDPRLELIGKLINKESQLAVQSKSKELNSKHRDCFVNVRLKAFELSQDNKISIDDAEARLSKTTGIINGNTKPPHQFQQSDLAFKFDLAIGGKKFNYGVFVPDPTADNPYYFKEITPEK